MTHPVMMAGVSVASLTALLGSASNYILAVPGAVLATIMLYQMVANKPGFLGGAFSRAKAIWQADRPYIAAVLGLGFAAAQFFHYPIPDWAITAGAFLGVANLHASTKGKTNP